MPKIDSYELRFHQIVNNVLDIIVEIDLNGTFTYVSPQVYDILGYYPDEVIGLNGFKFIHPEDLPKVIEEMKDILKSIKTNSVKKLTIEYRTLHKKGHYIFLSARGSIVEIEGNMKIIAVLRDVTESLKSTQKLKESEERYRLINENANDLIAVIDNNLQNIFVNNAYLSLGYSMGDISKLRPVDFIHPNDFDQAIKIFKDCLKTGTGISEFRFKHKDGHFSWFEVKGKTFRDENGDLRILLISRDITERNKAEQEIRESEEKFRTITEQSVIGFVIVQENRIIYFNNTVANIFGYSFEELNNKSLDDVFKFIHPEDRSITIKRFTRRKEGHNSEIEISREPFRVISKTGEIRWIDVYTHTSKFQEKDTTFATIVDVTKEKMAEKELQQLNELKSEFLRRASHELKTPLISIKGFTSLILKQYGGTIDSEVTSMLEEVVRGCQRLEDIIKNLIEATKIESSKLDLKATMEDLSFLIRFCINELRGLAKSRNHAIHLKIDENIITKFNKEQMYEVFTNLLSNAIKYTPPSGEIIIKSEIKDENVIISIQDNGIGFTIQEKEKVFQQFGKIERYGQGLDIGIDGSGLGLYLSKKIVELHGGDIWMESDGKNQGSIFYVSLPLIKD